LTVAAESVQVGPALIQRLAPYSPELAAHTRQLKGTAKLDAELAYHPDAPQPLHYDIHLQLKQGALSHALIPLPLEQLEASLRNTAGQIPGPRAPARSGAARLTRTVNARAPGPSRSLDGLLGNPALRVESLPITPQLFDPLPPYLRDIRDDFNPQG